jgi:type II secretory ATPase GspE/PulE/Tfp pilus assembly ATPase PilB-like protein
VLAGVHAGSTAEARQRLLELGVDRAVLNATLVGVLHQRLETRDCEPCEGARCGRCAGQRRLRVPVATLEVRS